MPHRHSSSPAGLVGRGSSHARDEIETSPDRRLDRGRDGSRIGTVGVAGTGGRRAAVPASYWSHIPQPLPPAVADHVAAVVLFGEPSEQFLRDNGAPAIAIGPLYAPKTLSLCADGDAICNGAPSGGPGIAHALYSVNGMTAQAAAFAAGRL